MEDSKCLHQRRSAKRSRCFADAATAGQPYNLVILDMQMPVMDGVMLARPSKRNRCRDTNSSCCSSISEQLERHSFAHVGINACLVKPAKQSCLFNCIADALGASPPTAPAVTVAEMIRTTRSIRQKARILLAEDNTINQDVALGAVGAPWLYRGCGRQRQGSCSSAQRKPYDIVLMDCMMPEMDGYEATKKIRELECAKCQRPPALAYHRDDRERDDGRPR